MFDWVKQYLHLHKAATSRCYHDVFDVLKWEQDEH